MDGNTFNTCFQQVLTPEDECAKHGKDLMVRTRPLPQFYIDGKPVGELKERWMCMGCITETRLKVEQELAEAREELRGALDMRNDYYGQLEAAQEHLKLIKSILREHIGKSESKAGESVVSLMKIAALFKEFRDGGEEADGQRGATDAPGQEGEVLEQGRQEGGVGPDLGDLGEG